MDLMKMMKQAKQMQEQMGSLQEQITEIEAEGSSGGGLVKVVLNGKGEMKSLGSIHRFSRKTRSKSSRT